MLRFLLRRHLISGAIRFLLPRVPCHQVQRQLRFFLPRPSNQTLFTYAWTLCQPPRRNGTLRLVNMTNWIVPGLGTTRTDAYSSEILHNTPILADWRWMLGFAWTFVIVYISCACQASNPMPRNLCDVIGSLVECNLLGPNTDQCLNYYNPCLTSPVCTESGECGYGEPAQSISQLPCDIGGRCHNGVCVFHEGMP